MTDATSWVSTTHDWTLAVDRDHLDGVRAQAEAAPPGLEHLVLEVLAYADEEAASRGVRGTAVVTVHDDGSVSVADDGRGTDTRRDASGRVVRKPVMATQDLRLVDADAAPALPDGLPRRGISTVAAVSTWLDHTNRRREGAWTQRYVHSVPQAELVELAGTGSPGTTVRFLPDPRLVATAPLDADRLAGFAHLRVGLRAPSAADPAAGTGAPLS